MKSTVEIRKISKFFSSNNCLYNARIILKQPERIPEFWKKDLIPIMCEENMIQKLPQEYIKVLEEQKK